MRYRADADRNDRLRRRPKALAGRHRRHGDGMLHNRLAHRGWTIDVKRTCRLNRERGLVRRWRRKKPPVPARQARLRRQRPHEVWRMVRRTGPRPAHRDLAVVEDGTKEAVSIVADTSMPALYATRVLDRVAAERSLPKVIRTDNGPEFAGWSVRGLGAASRP